MAWNIWEGNNLPDVAATIRFKGPDIVLLNEIESPQPSTLVEQLPTLPHYRYFGTASQGPIKTKGVAILSRYSFSRIRPHMVMLDNKDTNFGTLQATIRIDGLDHEVFSTRFAPMHERDHPVYDPTAVPQNRTGHRQALDLVRSVPSHVPVIFGGDFNANWGEHVTGWRQATWALEFRDRSGLTDVISEHPDPHVPGNPLDRVDYIYYRGPYKASYAEMRLGQGDASDHPYVYCVLSRTDMPADVRVPEVRTLPRAQAEQTIRAAGLEPRFTGSTEPGAWVGSQSPNAHSIVSSGSTVTLALQIGTKPVFVPDVLGLSPTIAGRRIREAGLVPRFTGSGGNNPYVISQSPRAEDLVSPGSTVTLGLRPEEPA